MMRQRALKWIVILWVLLLALPVNAADETVLKTQKDRVSYGIGVDLARSFRQYGVDFDVDFLIRGFKDQTSGANLLMTLDEVSATLIAYQKELMQQRAEEMKGNSRDKGVNPIKRGLRTSFFLSGNDSLELQ